MTSTPKNHIEKYLGIPYRLGGRGFDGADCIGLIWLYYRTEHGITLPDSDGKPLDEAWRKDPQARRRYAQGITQGAQKAGLSDISWGALEDGDILAFCKRPSEDKTDENIAYLGIHIGHRRMLTITENVATTHIVRLTEAWKDRFVKGFRCLPQSHL